MSYQVLARKYRPQRFADMVGQESVVRTLTNALAGNRLHHAYVFSGIRGIGKTTSARLLARALNCEKGPTPDPCGTCPACQEIAEGRSMDAVEIDAASNRGIEEVKSLIQSAQYAPGRDRFKVFIVDEFHMLTREAFNALLKTLEEPPRHVVFILATTELEKVPDTILSRCLLLNFRAVPLPTLREHLLEIAGKEAVELDASAADLIARKAGGSVRDAHSALDRVIALAGTTISREAAADVLGVVDASVLRRALIAILEGRADEALEVVAQVAESGSDPQGFLDDLLAEARAAMLTSVLPDVRRVLGLPDADIAEIADLAGRGSAEDHRRIVDRLIEAGPRLRTAAEPRFFLEALVIRLAHLTRLEPIADLVARLGDGGPSPVAASAAAPPARPPAAPRPPAADASPARPTPGAGPNAAGPAPGRPSASAPTGPAPRPGPAGAPAGNSSWRERFASGPSATADDADDTEPEPAPPPPPPAPKKAPPPMAPAAVRQSPLAAFRAGLPARLRGQVDHGVIRPDKDGLAVLVPPDRAHVVEHVNDQRFHLVASAAAAFGRPVPVRIASEEGILLAPPVSGEIEGLDFAARRLQARAASVGVVRTVASRFGGRVTSVQPDAAGS